MYCKSLLLKRQKMSNQVNRIISASAGTGKTYRLSLEYLALLLKFYGNAEFKPDQILVITFTRKATAEIRDRIYQHLDTLSNHKNGWLDLAMNLKKLTGVSDTIDLENPLTGTETRLLKGVYHHLITHKDELQVMTIDSYIHSIFRNLIRPVRGIDRFELDLKAVEKRLPFLFNELMTPALLKKIESLLSRRLKPSLDEFKSFFRSLIDNRWLYYLASKRSVEAAPNSLAHFSLHPELWQARADEYFQSFIDKFRQIIYNFDEYLQVKHNKVLSSEVIAAKFLNSAYVQLFAPLPQSFGDMANELEFRFTDEWVLLRLMKLLKDEKYLWNGQKVRASKELTVLDDWKLLHQQALEYLSNYLLFHLFLPEQREILDIWEDVLRHYDKLIYRYKDFTYDDIAWFTFEGLYSSEPPLFEAEKESVANEFYEFMCHRTRFMLIDEFQDTSILQFQILAPMIDELIAGEGSKPYGGLIVVGDEKQSIFGWRGGQRDLLLNLESIFPGLQTLSKDNLTDSWRSSPCLMNFINGIFGQVELHDYLSSIKSDWQYTAITGKQSALDAETVIKFKLRNYAPRSVDNKLDKAVRDFIEGMVIPSLPVGGSAGRSIAILARKNDELEMIRTLLAEHGITSEFQSSRSLLDQPLIKAMVFLLKFAVYNDWYDFLAFLRSDLVLMDGKTLKQVINLISAYQRCQSWTDEASVPTTAYNTMLHCHSCEGRNPRSFIINKTEIDFQDIPLAQASINLAKSLDKNHIYDSCLKLIQTCQIQFKLQLERDYVNIQRWLDIALEYEQNYQTDLPELQGFLRYCEDNREQEVFQQQDVVNSSAIQLLTIHKSKGLEFDSVFVWWNLKGFTGREDNKLSSWVHYTDKSYHNIQDIALTLHYNKVLETSSYKEIMVADDYREQLEELNNLYVALTRAKSRLYLYVAFNNTNGWEKYWSSYQAKGKLTPQHYAVKAAMDYMAAHAEELKDGYKMIGKEEVESIAEQNQPSPAPLLPANLIDLTAILPDWQKQSDDLRPKEDSNPDLNWKQSYLVDRDNLKGLIAHFYLAQIRYATRDEIGQAGILTLRQFGNLMTLPKLQKLIDGLEAQLPANKELFSPDYDIVYTEYSIFHKGHEYRIDRLMLNTRLKTFRIIDFKTGKTYNPEQLNIYAAILKNSLLPKDYTQEKEPDFIEIKL